MSTMASQPASRLAARMAQFDNVRRVEQRPDAPNRATIRVVNSGLGPKEIGQLRNYGWEISSISFRHNWVSVKRLSEVP